MSILKEKEEKQTAKVVVMVSTQNDRESMISAKKKAKKIWILSVARPDENVSLVCTGTYGAISDILQGER